MTGDKQDKILVIKLGALGDFIQALGPMKAIRNHHNTAHITLLTTKPFEKFARQCGYFDEIILDKRPKLLNITGWITLKKKLNSEHFTRIYDLQNNDRTALYFKLLKHPKPKWVGVAKGASHCNNSPERTQGHAYDGHILTLGLAGIKNITLDTLEWMKGDLSGFDLRKPYILLVPGCAPERPEKRWPAVHYARLANILDTLGYQPVIIGTQAEKDSASAIKSACPQALNLTDKTDFEHIAALARTAAGAIGNDTGPMHIIGVTGCPSMVVFSHASDPVKHAPKGANIQFIQKENLENLKPEEVIAAFRPLQNTNKVQTTLH